MKEGLTLPSLSLEQLKQEAEGRTSSPPIVPVPSSPPGPNWQGHFY